MSDQVAKVSKLAAALVKSQAPVQSATLQRKCSCGGTCTSGAECPECEKKRLQRSERSSVAEGIAPPIVHDVLRSPGQPLDAKTRAAFEPRFGHDFSKVRVHTDSEAAESARAVNALAYTVGPNIVFGAGQYQSGAGSNDPVLAHELTHVMQQRGETTVPDQISIGAPNDAFEREADYQAREIVANRRMGPHGISGAPTLLQRACGIGTNDPFCLMPQISNKQLARDGVVKALKLINPSQNEDSNIVPYDGNNAQVIDSTKIDLTGWTSGTSLHATASQKDVPGFPGLQVKIYFKDLERQNLTTIGLEHSGMSHVVDYIFNYSPIRKDRSNHTNADIAKDFCAKVHGGCP